jgi:hypothetical protein
MTAMNPLRPADLAARVVAWHNRHPLARRITREQVGGIGAVSLPFALAAPAADGAEPPAPALTPIFNAAWMYGATPARLDAFARKHGSYPLEAAGHWPWRHVDADLDRARAADAAGLQQRTARHLLSAVIDVDGRRVRVLVAPADLARAPVFGRRLFSLPRLVAAAGMLCAPLAFALWLGIGPGAAPAGHPPAAALIADPAPQALASAAAQAASSVARGVVALAPTAAETPTAPTLPASTPASDPAPDIVAARFVPTDVAPMRQDAKAAGPLVQIRPSLTPAQRREARQQAEALRPKPPPASGPAAPPGQVYALATPALRTRDDAQAQQALLQGLKAQVATPTPTQLDVMAAGTGWRVVWWPHHKQDDAERLRVEARARGLKLELIAF